MSKSCLVVDDSKVVRQVARRILEDLDFACREAADGHQALEACGEAMPEMILLDWNMPVMTGIEFLRALKAERPEEPPVVVFCTTESELPRIQEALSAGASEYVMKPFDSEIIHSKLAQLGLITPDAGES